MTTITASSTIGINLKPASYTSPVVIEVGVTITNPSYSDAVYTPSASTTSFVIQNDGTIIGAATSSGVGVYLAPGGSVTNTVKGSIAGYTGVKISGGAGTVVNDGSIAGASTSGVGVSLVSGGSVTNAAAASITGGERGVEIDGSAGTVVNDGSIATTDTLSSGNYGVYLPSGGSVTNAAAASITGNFGGIQVGFDGAGSGAGTVINAGTITPTGEGMGVRLFFGGSVTNAVGASITGTGGDYAIGILGAAGTVVNDGRLASTTLEGCVWLRAGGSATNAAGASITTGGQWGVYINGGVGSVVNYGSIVNTGTYTSSYTGRVFGSGVYLGSFGSVTNATSASIMGIIDGVHLSLGGTLINSGTIIGNLGVNLFAGGTLTNGGTIIGNTDTAVSFGGSGTYSNRLVLDPGFGFSGLVVGSTSASNTLELASAVSAGTVAGLGSQYLHFQSIVFDAEAQWSIAGIQRGLAGPITGLAAGDTIELTGDTATGSSFVTGVLTLDLAGGGSATLDLPGTFTSASDFHVTNVAAGADVTVACFAAGTRILTAAGEVPIDKLRFGDRVPTLGSGLARIAWLGHRRIDCRRHTRPTDAWPVRVRAGAFGERLPARDLLLSPDHAVLVDHVLVPIRHLLNGCTVVQEPVAEVVYYHLELTAHDVILAEGLPCESYLDTGNRAAFSDDETQAAGTSVAQQHDPTHPASWRRPHASELRLPRTAAAASRQD